MRAGRILVAAGVLIGVGSVVLALVPFHAPLQIKGGAVSPWPSSACGPPITEAWRTPTTGWFGYAPLSSNALPPHIGCRAPARKRLRAAALGLGLALLLGATAWFVDRRPGMGWQSQLRPTT